jgi:hypothetical protein
MESISATVWGSSAAVLVVLVPVTALFTRALRRDSRGRVLAFAVAWVVACVASGFSVRAVVAWKYNTATAQVVPGFVPTWLPAIAAVVFALAMLVFRLRATPHAYAR